jgi:hypothetical protein
VLYLLHNSQTMSPLVLTYLPLQLTRTTSMLWSLPSLKENPKQSTWWWSPVGPRNLFLIIKKQEAYPLTRLPQLLSLINSIIFRFKSPKPLMKRERKSIITGLWITWCLCSPRSNLKYLLRSMSHYATARPRRRVVPFTMVRTEGTIKKTITKYWKLKICIIKMVWSLIEIITDKIMTRN